MGRNIKFLLIAGLCVGGVAVLAQRGALGPKRFDPRAFDLTTKPKDELEKRVLEVIRYMRENHKTYLSVPDEDGRALRILIEAVNAKHVVEIGTSTGYSGLWICMALQKTGGKLTTFEYDRERAAIAREHFKKAGVDHMVTLIEGDAHETVKQLKEPIDVVFIDADKEGYIDYLNKVLPLVKPGGLILAHNANTVPDYIREVASRPELETILYMQGNGLVITLKKR